MPEPGREGMKRGITNCKMGRMITSNMELEPSGIMKRSKKIIPNL